MKKRTTTKDALEHIGRDQHELKEKADKALLERKYKVAIDKLGKLQTELTAALQIKERSSVYTIKAPPSKESRATAIALLSDVHLDEIVHPSKVSGRNKYNPEIAKQRCSLFFVNVVKLLKKESAHTRIDTLILALLGDYISGNIHEELLENCSMRPMEAILMAQELIVAGIKYILAETKIELVIPCTVGNHSRITKKVHISTEQGNSLEYFMYHNLRQIFSKEKRVKFVIAEGYHLYLKVYGFTLRFHHGHAIKYGGGIGGAAIPAYKAIAQWNKDRKADWDFWGHLHHYRHFGNAIQNGSVIGWNAYGVFIKAEYEPPRQVFCLVHENEGLGAVIPIRLNR